MSEADLRLIKRRITLIYRHQSIEAAFILHSYEKSRAIASALAPSQPDRLEETQIFVHALVGAFIGAMRNWFLSGFTGPPFARVDRALTLLEHGFTHSD